MFGKVLLTLPLQIGFPTAVDGRIDKIVDNLAVVQPTFMGAAPRIFEKAYGRISTMMADEGGVKAKLFDWAIGVGARGRELREQGEQPVRAARASARPRRQAGPAPRCGRASAARIRFFISGLGRAQPGHRRWFDSVGLHILEGYGLTETSAASFVNRPGLPVRHRRLAAARHRGPDRRGR